MGENMRKSVNKLKQIAIILLLIVIIAISDYFNNGEESQKSNITENNAISYDISSIPEYNGEIYVEINNNMPQFTAEDMELEDDYYSDIEEERVRNGNDKN